MKYFHVSTGLRGAYMSDAAFFIVCHTRRELRAILAQEINQLRDAGYIGATERAAATLAASAWREAHKRAPAVYPYCAPLRPRKGATASYGLFCAVATRAEWLADRED